MSLNGNKKYRGKEAGNQELIAAGICMTAPFISLKFVNIIPALDTLFFLLIPVNVGLFRAGIILY